MKNRVWKDLDVWEESHIFAIEIYKILAPFPKSEEYNLISQIKRAASSVPANIVEGHSRETNREFTRFLYIARGSLEEVRYFLLLAKDLNFLSNEGYMDIESRAEKVSKMLNGLIKFMKS